MPSAENCVYLSHTTQLSAMLSAPKRSIWTPVQLTVRPVASRPRPPRYPDARTRRRPACPSGSEGKGDARVLAGREIGGPPEVDPTTADGHEVMPDGAVVCGPVWSEAG